MLGSVQFELVDAIALCILTLKFDLVFIGLRVCIICRLFVDYAYIMYIKKTNNVFIIVC